MLKKRIISIILMVSMFITFMPGLTFAEESKENALYSVVMAKALPSGSRAVKIQWLQTEGANQYVIYGNLNKKKFEKIKTLDNTKSSFKVTKIKKKKLKKKKAYQFYVCAYKLATSAEPVLISKSKTCKVIVGNMMGKKNKYSNPTSVSIKNKLIKLEKEDSDLATKLAGISSKMYKKKKHLSSKYGSKYSYIVLNNEKKLDDTVVNIDTSGKLSINKNANTGDRATVYVQELNGVYNSFDVLVVTSNPGEQKQGGSDEGGGSGGGSGGGGGGSGGGGGISQEELNKQVEAAKQEALNKAKEIAENKVSAEATTTIDAANGLSADSTFIEKVKEVIITIKASADADISGAATQEEVEDAKELAVDKFDAIQDLISAAGDNPSQDVLDKLEKAINDIKDAKKPDEIDTKKEEGINEIVEAAGTTPDQLNVIKNKLIDKVSAEADKALSISKEYLSSDAKTSADAAINYILNDAKQKITSADSVDGIYEAKDLAVEKLRAIENLIERAGKNPSSDVIDELKKAFEDIKNADDKDELDQKIDDAKTKVDEKKAEQESAEKLVDRKEEAKDKVSAEAEKAKATVSDAPLRTDVKASADAAIDAIVVSAEADISAAATPEDVEKAKDLAIDKLEAIEDIIEKAGENPSGDVQDKIKEAIEDIKNAPDEEGLKDAIKDAEESINGTKSLEDKKEEAMNKVSAEAQETKATVSDAPLRADVKASADAAIDAIVASAEADISGAASSEAVEAAKDFAIDKLEAIDDIIERAGDNPSDDVQDKLKDAIEDIKNAKDEEELDDAVKKAETEIEGTKDLEDKQEKAKEKISEDAAEAKASISDSAVPDDAKASAEAAIDDVVASANAEISGAATPEEVEAAKDLATEKIAEIEFLLALIEYADLPKLVKPHLLDGIENIKIAKNKQKINGIVADAIQYRGKGVLVSLKGVSAEGNTSSEAEKFRVIKVNGKSVELLAMSGKVMAADTQEREINYKDDNGGEQLTQAYAGSSLDKYLNDDNQGSYYYSLPTDIKAAIIPQNIVQYAYIYIDDYVEEPTGNAWKASAMDLFGGTIDVFIKYYNSLDARINVGSRNVYALDLRDYVDYIGLDNSAEGKEYPSMYFEKNDTNSEDYCWLRSGYEDSYCYSMVLDGGVVEGHSYDNEATARASFTIDLSEVDWDVESHN